MTITSDYAAITRLAEHIQTVLSWGDYYANSDALAGDIYATREDLRGLPLELLNNRHYEEWRRNGAEATFHLTCSAYMAAKLFDAAAEARESLSAGWVSPLAGMNAGTRAE